MGVNTVTKEPTAEPLKQALKALAKLVKDIDSELLAYQMAYLGLRQSFPVQANFFLVGVEMAKQSTNYKQILRERYESSLPKILDQVEEEESFVAAFRAFQENRSKPIN